MKGQISAVLRGLSVSKRVAVVAILCGLLGMVPYLARTQEQNEGEETTQQAPLTGVTTSTQNPLQIALLRWYDANLTTHFRVGREPFGVAFAGTTIWVTNKADNTVMELQANDGGLLGTFGVGTGPLGVAFDGAHIWVANQQSNTVTKLQASDGAVLGTFGGVSTPFGVAFDGTDIWVTDGTPEGNVTKLRASDGAVLGSFPVGNRHARR